MKIYIKILSFLSIIGMLFFSACIDSNFQNPEKVKYNPNIDATTTIQELKNLYNDELTLIDSDIVIKGTVIANDKSGNYYKTIVIQDSSAGIEISLDDYELHNLYHVGDLIYIKCQGLYLGDYGGQVQLGADYQGSVGRISEPLIEDYLIKSDDGIPIVPKELDLSSAIGNSLINELVILKNVQFKRYNVGVTYGDIVLKEDKDTYVEDCSGNSIIVRTSGYADFAGDITPENNGHLTAVLTKYNNTYQLKIRNIDEIVMNNERCGLFFNEDFEIFENYDLFDKFGWTSYSVTDGSKYWAASVYNGNKFAKMTGFNYDTFTADENEDWLITPKFDFTGLSDIQFYFDNASNYSGPDIQVYISVDYDGTGNPNDFNWTELTSLNLSTGAYNWVTASSDLTSYVNDSAVYIGFKYTSSPADDAKTWEIDNVKLIVN